MAYSGETESPSSPKVWLPMGSGGCSTIIAIEQYRRAMGEPIGFGGVIVYSDQVSGIQKMQEALGLDNTAITVINPNDYRLPSGKRNMTAFGERMLEVMQQSGATDVGQHGWDVFTPKPVSDAKEAGQFHLWNQHPGNPLYIGGKHMHEIIPYGVARRFGNLTGRRYTQVAIHDVTPRVDGGAIVKISVPIPFTEQDTDESLQELGKVVERQINAQFVVHDIPNHHIEPIPVSAYKDYVRPGEEQLLYQAKKETFEAYGLPT